ncbi:MAG TPA: hypothetical protein VN688_31490 [Gemmataceae bacterium]|nr:hypothetical protein [Gemmataceae bacterium]
MQVEDLKIREMAGTEPVFDDVMHDFLCNSRDQFLTRRRPEGLVEAADLGQQAPWLWRLTFRTRGLIRDAGGEIHLADHHVIAVRFPPDYLRRANQFESLALVAPDNAFHPNLAPPRICLRIYPGQPLLEIAEGLHALIGWRLRQLAENDALNPDACVWGRSHLADLPIDNRSLFGRSLQIHLEPMGGTT